MEHLFARQRQYCEYFFSRIDTKEAARFLQICRQTQGLFVLTGVGKSGVVAEKMAVTLTSTGTRALFLPISNVLHGDLGIFTPEDLLICLSKSGETEEILDILPHIQKKGARVAAIVSTPMSRLAQRADVSIVLPVQAELCSFDLVPTTSTTVQTLFGDALAIALMEAKGVQLSEYAHNHPAGTIGKKTTLTVADLMLTGNTIPLAQPEQLLRDILSELSQKNCGCVLIAGPDRQLLGIFTDGDLRRALQRHGTEVLATPLSDAMTQKALSVPPDLLAWDALKIMQRDPKRWITTLPVLSAETIVGLLRMHDIIEAGVI